MLSQIKISWGRIPPDPTTFLRLRRSGFRAKGPHTHPPPMQNPGYGPVSLQG